MANNPGTDSQDHASSSPASTLVIDPPQLERNALGQVIFPASMPPPSARAPYASEFVQHQEAYLETNGWELVGRTDLGVGIWRDPVTAGGDRGIRTHIRDLPKEKVPGAFEPLYQVVVPPCRWDLHTGAAVEQQRARDSGGKKELTPLQKCDVLQTQLSVAIGGRINIADELDKLLRRPIPEQPQNVLASLKLLRVAVQTAAQKLRNVEEG